jgi:hypothetical protein
MVKTVTNFYIYTTGIVLYGSFLGYQTNKRFKDGGFKDRTHLRQDIAQNIIRAFCWPVAAPVAIGFFGVDCTEAAINYSADFLASRLMSNEKENQKKSN